MRSRARIEELVKRKSVELLEKLKQQKQ